MSFDLLLTILLVSCIYSSSADNGFIKPKGIIELKSEDESVKGYYAEQYLEYVNHEPAVSHVRGLETDHQPNDFVKSVHIIFMNHLDVGYANFINNILNLYFKKYFPRAVAIAEGLRKGAYVETFIYTTHPWLVTLYLDCPPNLVLADVLLQCPTDEEKATFIQAVKDGYITWHAGPFNLEVEMAHEPWLFEAGLDISSQLDKRFNINRKTRVLSQRDVPGLTQASIPLLAKHGITGVSVGVNDMTPPPAVPKLFVWQYGNDSVMGTFHPGGYPRSPGPDPVRPGGLSREDCLVVDEFAHALCFAFRSDNQGPPENVLEVLTAYEILRAEFPNALLKASTFDEYFYEAQAIRSSLPVVNNEIADTWIQGVASDPRKCAEYRAVARVMRDCFEAGKCSLSDTRVWNASRFLIKLPEHTWGLWSEQDTVNWSNEKFHKLRDTHEHFIESAKSWQEQRQFTYLAIDALQDHPVHSSIKEELDKLNPQLPDLTDFSPVTDMSQQFVCYDSDIKLLQFGTDGSIIKLLGNKSPHWECDGECRLGQFIYVSYDEKDFDEFGKVYNYNGHSAGYYKINLTANAHPESKTWPAQMIALYRSNAGICDFYVNIQMVDRRTIDWYGAPQIVWIRYTARKRGVSISGIDIDFQMFNKTSTRLPEAILFAFQPSASKSWQMSKMNFTVDPLNVMLNGSQYQHVTDDNGVAFVAGNISDRNDPVHFTRFRSPDVPLACPIVGSKGPHVFPAPLQPLIGTINGFAFSIYNNIWETNYIMWYPYYDADANFRARFFIDA